jgi:hypothetical protein
MKLTLVTLPPGRFRLATRPFLTGSPPVVKTIGTVVVAALAASAAGGITDDQGYMPAKQVRHEKQPSLIPSRVDFDRDVWPSTKPASFRPGGTQSRRAARHPLMGRNPTTGIAGCCARAASGHGRRALQ